MSDADREWFAAHPDADFYYRPPTPCDEAHLRDALHLGDAPGRFSGRVKVVRLEDYDDAPGGIRGLIWSGVVFFPAAVLS